MANQPISTLPRTTEINGVDTELFPFDQTGQTVAITGTNLLAQLLSLINGHGGIASISEPVVSGREKNYTITFDDGTTTTFTVTDGNGIASYEVAYAIGDDPTDPTATYGGYSETLPEATDTYPFVWTRLTLTDDNGVNTVVYSVGYKGKDGETVTGSEISYGISDSATVPPSSFSPTPVSATTSNPYQWTRIETSYSDSALDTTAYCVAGTPFVSVDAVTATTLPAGSSATAVVSNVISGAENEMSFAFGIPQGEKGDTGDYIDPIMSYGTSLSAVTEPTTWYNSPTSLDYSAGRFIWQKTDFTLSGAQTVQRTIKSIIGYIGANGSGSGTVTQVTFNGVAYLDDGTGNVNINVDPDDVGAIADPSVKNNGQVLTYDSTAGAWVAANPATGNVNTVNNVGVTAGTTNIDLKGSDIPIDSTPSTGKAVVTDANGKLAASGVTATELGYLSGVTSGIQAQINSVSGDVSGKVSKSGDTMTGALTNTSGVIIQHPSASYSDPPSAASSILYAARDASNNEIAQFRSQIKTNGGVQAYLNARRPVSGSAVFNGVTFEIGSDGARTVSFDYPQGVRANLGLGTSGALPITIAQGGTGQTGTSTSPAASNIVNAANGFTLVNAYYYTWGKFAQLIVAMKKTAAQTTATTMNFGTLKLGFPINTVGGVATNASISTCYVVSAGTMSAYGTWAANATINFSFIYLLP